jgi:ABC-type multidrug transport system fused ATPase/permease subunit
VLLRPDELGQDYGEAAIGARVWVFAEQNGIAGDHASGVGYEGVESLGVGAQSHSGYEQVLLDEASATITDDGKVGFVGRNGAGKSTLLKVILGEEELDGGDGSSKRYERKICYR